MPSLQKLARAIHDSGSQFVLAVTGGGSGAGSALLETPGASRSVLEFHVPYCHAALTEWIGAAPEHACSAETARAMAMAAWTRARRFAPDVEAHRLLGAGCTASLASDRPKRGDHRLHVALQTTTETVVKSLLLPNKSQARGEEESLATTLILLAISEQTGVDEKDRRVVQAEFNAALGRLDSSDPLHVVRRLAAPEWTELLLGARQLFAIDDSQGMAPSDSKIRGYRVVFPGAFNPPHEGHRAMAAYAARELNAPVAWELSIHNVDKPPLDFHSIAERVRQIRDVADPPAAVLTNAPTFLEKAQLFPGATFVVGADTIERIADPAYYDDNARRCDAAINRMADLGCRFLVFGRTEGQRFETLGRISLPPALEQICIGVPESEFHMDVSSTELRNRQ